MGIRFRKSVNIAKGVKLNFNKDSVSLTTGTKGAHFTINSKGTTTSSLGIPGTGLSYQKRSTLNNSTANTNVSNIEYLENDIPPFEEREKGDPTKALKLTKDYIYINGNPLTPDELTELYELTKSYSMLCFKFCFILYIGTLLILCLVNPVLDTLFSSQISTTLIFIIPLIPSLACFAYTIYLLVNASDLKYYLKLYNKYLPKLMNSDGV